MGETHLHKAAKQILMKKEKVRLPEFRGREYGGELEKDKEYLTVSLLCSPMHKDLLEQSREVIKGFEEQIVAADHVREEERLEGLRPDIILKKGDRELLVEIRVTHETEKEKINMIREREFPCIEIDLSQTPRDISMQDLEGVVVGDGPDPAPRKWLSHPRAERKDAELRHERKSEFARRIRTVAVRKLKFYMPQFGMPVVACPINKYNGWYSARISDCSYCVHHVASFCQGMNGQDEKLHVELTGRKDKDIVFSGGVVYCACTVEMARKFWRHSGAS